MAQSEKKPSDGHVARAPRVRVTPLHRISFRLAEGTHEFDLLNISSGGMAIVLASPDVINADEAISGYIKIVDQEYHVTARVRHVKNEVAGCEFTDAPLELRREIEKHLRVEMQAVNLRVVSPEFLKPDPRGHVDWFTDGRRSEIYCVSDALGIVEFHINILGYYIEGGRGQKPKTGAVVETDSADSRRNRANLVNFERGADQDFIRLARIFVHNSEAVSPRLREALEKCLAEAD